jgi:hypothetical protein
LFVLLVSVEEVDAGRRVQLRSIAMVKKDLLTSEEEYVYCVGLIVDGYLAELEGNPHKPDFIVERRASIFGNIGDVYDLHKKLLDGVRKNTTTDSLCEGFLQLDSSFQVYVEYLKTISSGWKALAAFGGSFFEDVKREKRLGYPLLECYNRTFLRLKQYCDLFKELLAGTHKEELHSVSIAQKTLGMLTQVWRRASSAVALGNLRGSPVGVLPEEGLLLMDDFLVTTIQKKKKKKEQFTVFLHPNCVLLARKEKKDEIHPPLYIYHEHLLCSALTMVEDYKGKGRFALSSGSSIATSDTIYALQPMEEEDVAMLVKVTWTTSIQELLMKQLEALKEEKGGTQQQSLPPPIVHHVNLPKDRSPRSSHGSKNVSKIASTISDVSHKSQSRVVTSPRIVTEKEEPQGVDLFEVFCTYSSDSKETLQLPVGQLVEVLDQTGERWLVCTYSEDGAHEATEGFVPSKCLRLHKSDRRGSVLSQYSVSDAGAGDRRSTASRGSQVERVSPLLPRSRPTSTASPKLPHGTSRPSSTISIRNSDLVPPTQPPPSQPPVSLPLHQPSMIAEDILWYAVDDYTSETGFHLPAGAAVQVLDTSGTRWYVCTVEEPEEGFVPPGCLSQAPTTPQVGTQSSVIEATTPTRPIGTEVMSQDSFESVTTPVNAGERASLGRVSGVLRDALEEVTATRSADSNTPVLHPHLPVSGQMSTESARTQYQMAPEDSFEDVTPGDPISGGFSSPRLPGITESTEVQAARKLYRALANYSRNDDSGAPLEEGQLYEVLDSSDDVWWLVVPVDCGSDQKQGWAPANHLELVVDIPTGNMPADQPSQGGEEVEEPPPSDHESEPGTPVHTEAETPGILVAENPLESSLTRSQIESHKPKPPKYFVSKAHVMAGDERELSLFLGQKVEVLDDSSNDWWLVKTLDESSSKRQGWVPSKALDPFVSVTLEQSMEEQSQESSPERQYMTTTAAFTGDPVSHQLSVGCDVVVEVIDNTNPDWVWVCTVHSDQPQEGWLPRDVIR